MISITTLEQAEHYRSRKLLRELSSTTAVRNKMLFTGDGLLYEDWLPYISAVALYDPRNRRLPAPWTDRQLRIADMIRNPVQDEAVAETAQVVVPANEIWEVVQIYATARMSAAAANRQCIVTVAAPAIGLVGLGVLATTGVLLTAGQTGGAMLTAGFAPNLVTNDNGVTAVVADENSLPIYLGPAGIIAHESDNDQAGDVLEIRVSYRLVYDPLG